MSNNLLKTVYMDFSQKESRVINSNERMEKRMGELSDAGKIKAWGRTPAENREGKAEGGFTELNVEALDLLTMDGEEHPGDGNVIKAGEDAEAIRSSALEEAEQILADARVQAEQILSDARAQAEQDKIQMLAQAKQEGYEEGQKQARREAEQIKDKLSKQQKQMEENYQKQMEELEPLFVDTITGIYEHIFHVDLQSHREILMHLISTVMRKVEENKSFLVHVSKEDYPYVSMEKKQLAEAASPGCVVEIVEDMTLSRNQCLIETEGGIFDCGLGTQLAELGQKLRLLSYEK